MSNTNSQGIFIAEDYIKARKYIKDVLIAPFDDNRAKGTGYNLSPSTLIYSVNKKRLLKVRQNEKEVFVWVDPHDTILTISKEYIMTERSVAGTINSRVRMSAKGLGNVSTTLDPEWKGKLLLAISNPSKKRIKLCIEEKSEGTAKPVPLVTMVLFHTGRNSQGTFDASLHLDNPPMRTDIWSDLTEKPAGLRGAKYEKFQQIIKRVTEFKAQKGARYNQLQHIIDIVLAVKASITRGDPIPHIQSLPVGLAYEVAKMDGDKLLKDKFSAWNDLLKKATSGDDFLRNEWEEAENGLLRECRYLIMCDEVEQHDQFIRQQIEQYWEGGMLVRILKKWVFPNLATIFAILFIVLILFIAFVFWSKKYTISQKVVFTVISTIITGVVDFLLYKFSINNR